MIPQRVKLKGFLCYKEEQEISFDGNASLWMLSGLNGSGKSSIFDGVTYALFGHHRGGSQNAVELINKDSDGLLVEFDFLLDSKAYRAKRTYRRTARGGGSGTQQLFAYTSGADNQGSWAPIPDTQLRDGFKSWVEQNIGLNYETFTSSVLLLQGKAEKLLDSSPSGRHQVLSGIVGLERYKALHEAAVAQRKDLDSEVENLRRRQAALPAVESGQLALAEIQIEQMQARCEASRTEIERLQDLEFQAKGWKELREKLGMAQQRCAEAVRLLEDAQSIEAAVERLRQLREVLPRLQEMVGLRNQAHQAEREIQELHGHKAKLTEQLTQREHSLGQAREKRTLLHKLLADDEARQREITALLRQSSVQMEKLRQYEAHGADVARLRDELAAVPAEPAKAVSAAREECERLTALAVVVPLLARLHERRAALLGARKRVETAQQELHKVEVRGKEQAGTVERLKPLLEEAKRAAKAASEQATEARTIFKSARESLKQVSQLDGAKVCRACGQALTPQHVREEKQRRGGEVQQAEERVRQAETALKQAQAAEQEQDALLSAAERAHQEARLEYRDFQNRSQQARAEVERLQSECAQAYAELPKRYAVRIHPTAPADWTATSYPTADDLATLRAETANLMAARQRLAQAEAVQQKWFGLKTQEKAAADAMHRLQKDLPADHQTLRRQYAELEAQDDALEQSLQGQRAGLREIDEEIERLSRQREEAQTQLNRHATEVKKQELSRQQAEHAIATNLKALPPSWRSQAEKAGLRQLNELLQERDELDAAGTDARGRKLQEARLNLDMLQRERDALESQQTAFSAEARQEPTAIAAQLAETRRDARQREDDLITARQLRAELERYQQQHSEIAEQLLRAEAEQARAKLLEDLLGRDRLQLYLVRQAERQVVAYANAVLDRLSGGQLYLKLSGEADGEGSAARALELQAFNRSTGEQPFGVSFLSGSQKFRVAVSLALGIGQYASRQHRPIEAVIIDEGFGCLDSQGRQVMIQELQNLRNQMRCILLVSHQEEFAEAFPDGFTFSLEGGSARIRPFQK